MSPAQVPSVPSPARNRVTPSGDVVAVPLRGAWTGNRGILHRGTDVVRGWTSARWIVCALEFRGYRAAQWTPGRWTPLFFHDEAVALAAGHRPCALCRRASYEAFRDAWPGSRPGADALDRVLHAERLRPGPGGRRVRRTHEQGWADVVPGAFVVLDGPALVRADAVVPWTTAGYGAARERPRTGRVTVLTPPSTCAVLRAGYPVQVDASADAHPRG